MAQDRSQHPQPAIGDVAKGALAGVVAGLVASLAMNQVQALVSKLSDSDDSGGESTTAKAADRLSGLAIGKKLPDDRKETAGNVVHYALGGALGLAYGIVAEYRPVVTGALGTGLSLSTFALLDEGAVPAVGLATSPIETPMSEQLYALGSHLVFGSVTEIVRRTIRGAI